MKYLILILALLISLNMSYAEQCPDKQQSFDGRCYPCNPEIGYLQFNPNDRSILCITCQEGFVLKDGGCVFQQPTYAKDKISVFIDNSAQKISTTLNTNLITGYIIILILISFILYAGFQQLKRL